MTEQEIRKSLQEKLKTGENLTLSEAAIHLNMSKEGLRQKVCAGKVPGAKVGKCWVFSQSHLEDHLRSLYTNSAKVTQGNLEELKKWPCVKTNMASMKSISRSKESEYDALVKQLRNQKRSNCTTN